MNTYADIAKKLGKRIDLGDKLAADSDKIRSQTGNRIKDKAMKLLYALAEAQVNDANIPRGKETRKLEEGTVNLTPATDAYADYQKYGWVAPASNFGFALGDFLQRNAALNRMTTPAAPAMMPGVILNKSVPIGDQTNEIKTQQLTMDKQADGFSSQASRFAAKALNSATAQKQLGTVYAERDRMKNELTNREYLYNHYVNQDNINALRKYQEDSANFTNQKLGARSENLSNLLTKMNMLGSEYDTQRRKYLADANREQMDLEKFKIAMKNFDPDLTKRMFEGTPWAAVIEAMIQEQKQEEKSSKE